MEIYNPKDWFKAILNINKSDTLRQLWPIMLGVGIFCLGIAYWEINYLQLHLQSNSWVKNIPVMHNLLGFAISMLLVFRTNTAYDRWWEGRKQWGELVNASRNLAMKLHAFLPEDNRHSRSFFRKTIPLYAKILKYHLRADSTRLMLDAGMDGLLARPGDIAKHQPNHLARLMVLHISQLHKEGKISAEQWLILNNELTAFTNICGACERIKNTPIPYSYSSFIKKFIVIYVLTLPFGYVFSLGYYVALIVVFVFYVLMSLEIIAEEIEDPFGTDANDLPMEKMAENIRNHIEEILEA